LKYTALSGIGIWSTKLLSNVRRSGCAMISASVVMWCPTPQQKPATQVHTEQPERVIKLLGHFLTAQLAWDDNFLEKLRLF
jgi:hypothetical protein